MAKTLCLVTVPATSVLKDTKASHSLAAECGIPEVLETLATCRMWGVAELSSPNIKDLKAGQKPKDFLRWHVRIFEDAAERFHISCDGTSADDSILRKVIDEMPDCIVFLSTKHLARFQATAEASGAEVTFRHWDKPIPIS